MNEERKMEEFEDAEVLRVEPLRNFGRPLEIIKLFGGKEGYKMMVREVEKRIYGVDGK